VRVVLGHHLRVVLGHHLRVVLGHHPYREKTEEKTEERGGR
jgi:hypothetical protein